MKNMNWLKRKIRAYRINHLKVWKSRMEWENFLSQICERDDADRLLEIFRLYKSIERKIITTNPTLVELDQDNLSSSYKWLPFPVQDGMIQSPEELSLSDVEEFPNDYLAAFLVQAIKNLNPKNIHFESILIDHESKNAFRFCISGSASLEGLRTLFLRNQAENGSQAESEI